MSLLKKNSRIESDYDDEERKRQSILGQTHQGSWLDSCLREEEDKEHEFEQNSQLIARCTEKVYREGGKFLYTHTFLNLCTTAAYTGRVLRMNVLCDTRFKGEAESRNRERQERT